VSVSPILRTDVQKIIVPFQPVGSIEDSEDRIETTRADARLIVAHSLKTLSFFQLLVLNVEVPNVGGVNKHRLFGFDILKLSSSKREVESDFTFCFVLFVTHSRYQQLLKPHGFEIM
jgi:hypothetical protein